MDQPSTEHKGFLKHGDVTAIARKLGLSQPHVSLCARGLRQGSPELHREIARVKTRNAAKGRPRQLQTVSAA